PSQGGIMKRAVRRCFVITAVATVISVTGSVGVAEEAGGGGGGCGDIYDYARNYVLGWDWMHTAEAGLSFPWEHQGGASNQTLPHMAREDGPGYEHIVSGIQAHQGCT